MKKVKFLLIFNTLFVASFCVAADICNVCLDTPPETQQLHTGKGGSHNPHGHTTKLEKPLFTGPLFYSLDNSEKLPLPLHSGVFFKLYDQKNIASEY